MWPESVEHLFMYSADSPITTNATLHHHCMRKLFLLKIGFHQRKNRSRSSKDTSNLVKTENRSRKRCHKLDGIGVGRIRKVSFFPIPLMTTMLLIQRKLDQSRKQKRKDLPITLPVLNPFQYSLLLATPTLQFSLHRKRLSRERYRYFSSDSVGLIFT